MSKLFFSLDTNTAKELSNLAKSKKLRKIYRGIYTDNLKEPASEILKKNWMKIIPYIISNGILSFRTAFELKPSKFSKNEDIIFVTSSYTKTISLPGLIIKVNKGDYNHYLEQVLPNLRRSNIPRILLENLTIVKRSNLKNKTIGVEGVEKYLAKELQLQGESRLNNIRDEAKKIAKHLGYDKEFKKLNQIISTLLSSNTKYLLKTQYAKSIIKKQPYDDNRLQLFENLSIYLQKCSFLERKFNFSVIAFKNLSFFESYFSNYIEGTEFLIDEAEDIVFKGEEIYQRHEDSHDILANFYLTNDYNEMSKPITSVDNFLEILKSRHAYLMKERPNIQPGHFKEKPNKAGNTYFVEPHNVIGTLTQAYEIYKLLKPGMPKAFFMHFLISEVHPFNDGNGRLSRIMLNSELVQAELIKIIVPTVCRDNYLSSLRRVSRENYFQTYCKVLDQLQSYTFTIPWNNYEKSREKIESDYANRTPDDGLPIFNRALRQLSLSHCAE